MNLHEIGCGDVYCIKLVQDRIQWQAFVNMGLNLGVSDFMEGGEFLDHLSEQASAA
jgi:hypothetical protein